MNKCQKKIYGNNFYITEYIVRSINIVYKVIM